MVTITAIDVVFFEYDKSANLNVPMFNKLYTELHIAYMADGDDDTFALMIEKHTVL